MVKEHALNIGIIIKLVFILLVLHGCNNLEKEPINNVIKKYDSLNATSIVQNKIEETLKNELIIKNNFIYYLEQEIPNIIQQKFNNDSITLYESFGLSIEIKRVRPLKNSNTFLCVPGAFTSKSSSIEGIFIEKGITINKTLNRDNNGTCIIKNNTIEIIPINQVSDSLIDNVIKNRFSLFQQVLLMKNFKIVNSDIWGSRKYLRRALVLKNNKYYMAESFGPISTSSFQKSLLNIGIKDAIYLDMGTWSEGWVKDYNRNITRIGSHMINTQKQTNWIVFEIRPQ